MLPRTFDLETSCCTKIAYLFNIHLLHFDKKLVSSEWKPISHCKYMWMNKVTFCTIFFRWLWFWLLCTELIFDFHIWNINWQFITNISVTMWHVVNHTDYTSVLMHGSNSSSHCDALTFSQYQWLCSHRMYFKTIWEAHHIVSTYEYNSV